MKNHNVKLVGRTIAELVLGPQTKIYLTVRARMSGRPPRINLYTERAGRRYYSCVFQERQIDEFDAAFRAAREALVALDMGVEPQPAHQPGVPRGLATGTEERS